MDRIDQKILAELQHDASISVAELSDRVGRSQTPCWRRVQKLQEAGVITGRVALVDPLKVGLGLTVFVEVEAGDHSTTWRDAFAALVAAQPEVVEVYRMAGEADYLLKVVTTDVTAFDALYKRLTKELTFRNVTSQFAMERMAFTTALPLAGAS